MSKALLIILSLFLYPLVCSAQTLSGDFQLACHALDEDRKENPATQRYSLSGPDIFLFSNGKEAKVFAYILKSDPSVYFTLIQLPKELKSKLLVIPPRKSDPVMAKEAIKYTKPFLETIGSDKVAAEMWSEIVLFL